MEVYKKKNDRENDISPASIRHLNRNISNRSFASGKPDNDETERFRALDTALTAQHKGAKMNQFQKAKHSLSAAFPGAAAELTRTVSYIGAGAALGSSSFDEMSVCDTVVSGRPGSSSVKSKKASASAYGSLSLLHRTAASPKKQRHLGAPPSPALPSSPPVAHGDNNGRHTPLSSGRLERVQSYRQKLNNNNRAGGGTKHREHQQSDRRDLSPPAPFNRGNSTISRQSERRDPSSPVLNRGNSTISNRAAGGTKRREQQQSERRDLSPPAPINRGNSTISRASSSASRTLSPANFQERNNSTLSRAISPVSPVRMGLLQIYKKKLGQTAKLIAAPKIAEFKRQHSMTTKTITRHVLKSPGRLERVQSFRGKIEGSRPLRPSAAPVRPIEQQMLEARDAAPTRPLPFGTGRRSRTSSGISPRRLERVQSYRKKINASKTNTAPAPRDDSDEESRDPPPSVSAENQNVARSQSTPMRTELENTYKKSNTAEQKEQQIIEEQTEENYDAEENYESETYSSGISRGSKSNNILENNYNLSSQTSSLIKRSDYDGCVSPSQPPGRMTLWKEQYNKNTNGTHLSQIMEADTQQQDPSDYSFEGETLDDTLLSSDHTFANTTTTSKFDSVSTPSRRKQRNNKAFPAEHHFNTSAGSHTSRDHFREASEASTNNTPPNHEMRRRLSYDQQTEQTECSNSFITTLDDVTANFNSSQRHHGEDFRTIDEYGSSLDDLSGSFSSTQSSLGTFEEQPEMFESFLNSIHHAAEQAVMLIK